MFAFESDSIGGYTERVFALFTEKLLFAISLAVFDDMVTFAYRARSNGSFFGVSRVFNT